MAARRRAGGPGKRAAKNVRAKQSSASRPTRVRSAASQRLIERLRRICLALPEATEKEAWGEPTWRVKDKLFAQLDDHHHGSPHCSVWLPAPLGLQETLVESDPDRFFRPPYVGHKGWIGVVLDPKRPAKADWKLVAGLVEQAWRLIAPAKLAARLGGGDA
jgi:hypothetical protein